VRVRLTGTRSSGEALDQEVEVPDEMQLGDSFKLSPDERVLIVASRTEFTPKGAQQIVWTVEPYTLPG
jgi:hypothetical protein